MQQKHTKADLNIHPPPREGRDAVRRPRSWRSAFYSLEGLLDRFAQNVRYGVTAARLARTPVPPSDESAVPVYDARDLIMGGDRAEIRLDGKVYTLRITRAGKLILTK